MEVGLQGSGEGGENLILDILHVRRLCDAGVREQTEIWSVGAGPGWRDKRESLAYG